MKNWQFLSILNFIVIINQAPMDKSIYSAPSLLRFHNVTRSVAARVGLEMVARYMQRLQFRLFKITHHEM
jgi:hypothetical protein